MYRVLLVEDEATVREGIVQKIRWEDHGFTLAGACENGKQAMEMLRIQPVEVIITDINMPVMDGLTLARQVHESWPDIRVVILTGYDDFSYAQSAIRHKVHEYILKPITAKQLRELLDKLFRELNDNLSDTEETRAVMRRNLLARLLSEEIPQSEIEQRIREFSLPLQPSSCCAALIEGTEDVTRQAMEAAAQGRGELVQDGTGRLVLLCGDEQAAHIVSEAAGSCRSIISAVIGCRVEHPGLLCHSYREANGGWEHLYRMASGGIWLAADILSAPDNQQPLGELRREVLQRVKLLSREAAREALAAFIAALAGSTRTRDAVLSQLQKLTLLLSEYAEEQQLDLPEGVMEELNRKPNLAAAHQYLEVYLEQLIQAGENQGDSSVRQGVLAVQYIKERYGQPDLSLQQLTAYLAVSTSRFSVLFKNHTGVTFVEFLTRLRMHKAQELLVTTDKKNYEIAAEVGYDDPGYFRSSFKKFTGVSPSEYRKKHRG